MEKKGFFGLTIWGGLVTGNIDWVKSLGLMQEDYEFNPDRNGWNRIFDGLNRIMEETKINEKMDLCIHFESGIPDLLSRFDMLDDLNTAIKENPINIEVGMHSTFKDTDLILSRDFRSTLKKDLMLCDSMNGKTIVEHPPKGPENVIDQMVEELTSDYIIGEMKKYPEIILSWENLPSSEQEVRFFGTLGNLIEFRKRLSEKLHNIGEDQLIEQHQFCLDTGHLLIAYDYYSRQGNQQWLDKLKNEIKEFAKNLKAWHLHANDGSSDNHIAPASLEFFDLSNRKMIDRKKFSEYSQLVNDWIQIAEFNSRKDVHYHMELLRMPFSLNQVREYALKLNEIIG